MTGCPVLGGERGGPLEHPEQRGAGAGPLGTPTLRIRYKDFRDPAARLREIAAFAGLPGGASQGSCGLTGPGTGGPTGGHAYASGNPMRFKTGQIQIRPDSTRQDAMFPRQRRTVTTLTLPLLMRYGYLRGPGERPGTGRGGRRAGRARGPLRPSWCGHQPQDQDGQARRLPQPGAIRCPERRRRCRPSQRGAYFGAWVGPTLHASRAASRRSMSCSSRSGAAWTSCNLPQAAGGVPDQQRPGVRPPGQHAPGVLGAE